MPYEFGDVVLVRFPFTNQMAFKQRPAVVISNRAYNTARPDAVIMAITSQLHSPAYCFALAIDSKPPSETWHR
jgi:mRNA interferase MazF